MPKSATTEIADAITTSLNGAVFSRPFTAVRSRRPSFRLQDLETVRVSVVPVAVESAMADRARDRGLHKVQVWVQQRVGGAEGDGIDDAEFDALDYLCQEIDDHFRHKRLPGYEQAVWQQTERKPLYWPAHLDRQGVFTGVVTLTYSLVR